MSLAIGSKAFWGSAAVLACAAIAAGAVAVPAGRSTHVAERPAQPGARQFATPPRSKVVFTHALPPLEGGHLAADLVEVNYGPGDSSAPHTHPCPVLVYVLQGAVRSQVQGESARVYRRGESFYEAPGGIHAVSANASRTAPAKFLAIFVCDHDAPLSTVSSQPKVPGGNQQ